jgi:hypothetical protein
MYLVLEVVAVIVMGMGCSRCAAWESWLAGVLGIGCRSRSPS